MIVNRTSALLGERRLSIRDLARGAGISYTSAYGMYSGESRRFDADVLDRICAFLGVGVGELLVYAPGEGDGAQTREGAGADAGDAEQGR